MRLQALDGLFWTGSPTDGMADRLVKNFSTLPRYFGLFLVPTGLTIFHKVPDVTSLNFPLFIIKWTAILSVSILIFSFLVKRLHNQAALFGILWFVANYVPVSNIVAIPSWTMAERYMYIPAAGLCVVTGELIGHLYYQGLYWKRFVMTGVFAIMTLLSVLTVRRNLEWRNEITLFGSAIRNDPASATAHFNMGIALKENGDFAGAKQEWLKTIQIQPDHSDALTQMGTLMAFQGDYQKGEQYYHAALHFDPSNAMAHYNLAKIYEIKGNRAGALAQYELALKYLSVTYKEYRQEIERKLARLRMDGSPGTSK